MVEQQAREHEVIGPEDAPQVPARLDPLAADDRPPQRPRVIEPPAARATPPPLPQIFFTDQVGTLVAALAEAQATFDEVERNLEANVSSKRGASFNLAWADLAAFFKAVRPKLAGQGIAFAQFPTVRERSVTVRTILFKGEQRMWNDFTVPVGDLDPWGVSSATTYARKAGFASLVGIAAESDDEGAEASGHEMDQRRERPAAAPRQSARQEPPPEPPADTSMKTESGIIADYTARPDGVTIVRLDTGLSAYTRSAELAARLKKVAEDKGKVTLTTRLRKQDSIRLIEGMVPSAG